MKGGRRNITGKIPALILLALAPTGCDKTGPSKEPEPEGAAFARVIFRDRGTRRDIERTARVRPDPAWKKDLRLVVTKSRYRLDLYRREDPVKTYPVALGGSPAGSKEREGDGKTPEGTYSLMPNHESPGFGKCFYVNYPNEKDAERGLREGLIDERERREIGERLERGERPPYDTALGGLILLHGTKDRHKKLLTKANWTRGCIAMENEDLEELLSLYSSRDRPLLTIRK